MIDISGLTYYYPDRSTAALRDVSLQIDSGEFVLLTGPSGAGKSTLLRVLNGVVPHFTGGTIMGRVNVAGQNAVAAGPHTLSRKVGFVFQNPEAQAVMERVEDEIAFGLENTAVPPPEMRLRVEEALDLLELGPLRNRSVRELSGGERQRLAIATVLALQPEILALDEPTSQLDPKSAESLLQTLVRLNETLGLTIVLAEHRLERTVRYAERTISLQQGSVVLDGPTDELLPQMPQLAPVAELGRRLGWRPIPLTVKAARQFAQGLPVNGTVGTKRKPAVGKLLLDVRGVHFAYGRTPVLKGIDLQVRAGEIVVMMGRNGSGKSTLLRCVAGLLRANRGEIAVMGRGTAGRDVADICREMAYLPQNPDDLLFAESVTQELETTLRNHGMLRTGQGAERTAMLLSELGLLEHAQAYPRDLSVGQRQRVALGAVMITEPELLLLDEPTRGLDAVAKQSLAAMWKRWRDTGKGILLVTHDVELAAQVADRVVFVSDGEIIASGSAVDVMGASPLFSPQIARLFPGRGWLTVADALAGLGYGS